MECFPKYGPQHGTFLNFVNTGGVKWVLQGTGFDHGNLMRSNSRPFLINAAKHVRNMVANWRKHTLVRRRFLLKAIPVASPSSSSGYPRDVAETDVFPSAAKRNSFPTTMWLRNVLTFWWSTFQRQLSTGLPKQTKPIVLTQRSTARPLVPDVSTGAPISAPPSNRTYVMPLSLRHPGHGSAPSSHPRIPGVISVFDNTSDSHARNSHPRIPLCDSAEIRNPDCRIPFDCAATP